MQDLLNQLKRLTEVSQEQANALNDMQQRHQAQLQQQQAQLTQQQNATLRQLIEMQGIVVKLQKRPESKRITIVVVEGIGKPSTCAADPTQFSSLAFKPGNFLEGMVAGMKEALDWVQEQEKEIKDLSELRVFLGESVEPKDAVSQKNMRFLEDHGFPEPEVELSGLSLDMCAIAPEPDMSLLTIDGAAQDEQNRSK